METTHISPEGCWVTDGHWQDELMTAGLLGAQILWTSGPDRTHIHMQMHMNTQWETHAHKHRSWGEEGHGVMVWAATGAEQSVNTLHSGEQTFPPISIWQTLTDNILQHIYQPCARTIITFTYPWVLGSLWHTFRLAVINTQMIPESERRAEADRQHDTWTRTQTVHSLSITGWLQACTHHPQLKNGWESLWDKSRESITSYNIF